MTSAAIAALCGAVALLAIALLRSRQHVDRLQRRLARSSAELEQLQLAFARFAPSAVVESIASRGVTTTGKKCDVTVLFADLRGFTALGDQLDPDSLVALLNGYFRAMSTAIAAHNGHVSKFIGDGLMAFFGGLEHNPWQCQDAVRAALGMREALVGYNAQLRDQGRPQLRFGVGIHRGVGVTGVIGNDELMEFTVIGDVVNVASRIETLTRTHDVDILVSERIRRELDDRFNVREMAPATVKGKPAPLVTYAIVGSTA